MPSGPATLSTIATAVTRLLAQHGACYEDELLDDLAEAGIELGVAPEDTLGDVLDSGRVPAAIQLADERWLLADVVAAGRVLTHRLSADEVTYDLLLVEPDLLPLSELADDTTDRLRGGGTVELVAPGHDRWPVDERGVPVPAPTQLAWRLPAGRLAGLGLAPGDLVGLRAGPDGWELASVAEAVLDRMAARRAAERLRAAVLDGEAEWPCPLIDTVWMLCVDQPDLFGVPVPPLGELIEDAGLLRDGGLLAPAGFDMAGWRVGVQLAGIREEHDLDGDGALTVLAALGLYHQVEDLLDVATEARDADQAAGELMAALVGAARPAGAALSARPAGSAGGTGRQPPSGPTVGSTLGRLADPTVAAALLVEAIGEQREGAPALATFAEALEGLAPRPARVALRWIRARALERAGDVLGAERVLLDAQSLDPAWPLSLYDLARYVGDRGDAARALDLVRRSQAPPDDPLGGLFAAFVPQPRSDLGRNQPCWCGSNRKYKQCHMRHERLPLADRAAWLYQKAGVYLSEGPWRAQVWLAAAARAPGGDPDPVAEATQDPLVSDAVLFEGGAFAAFLGERGVLLPDDERLLAEQWLLVERSVYEVETVTPGAGLTVRDLRSGDRVEVRERTASRVLAPGFQFCARVVPAGDTWQIFGGVEPVGLAERDGLLALLDDEPDARQLVAFLSRRLAPPQVTNTEGDPFVVCSARLHVPDPQALSAVLDRVYERDDDEPAQQCWREFVTTQGMQRVRATLRLEGAELVVETNSEARQDRVLASVRAAVPDLVLVEDRRESADELAEAASRAPDAGGGGAGAPGMLAPDSPELAAVLEEIVRAHERAWLDESVPALGGCTPREAAADPTRRSDLVRLLDSMSADEGLPGRMSRRRLRDALGLTS